MCRRRGRDIRHGDIARGIQHVRGVRKVLDGQPILPAPSIGGRAAGELARGEAVADEHNDPKAFLDHPDLKIQDPERDENQQAKERKRVDCSGFIEKRERRFNGALPAMAMLESSRRARRTESVCQIGREARSTVRICISDFGHRRFRSSSRATLAGGKLRRWLASENIAGRVRSPHGSGRREVDQACPKFQRIPCQ